MESQPGDQIGETKREIADKIKSSIRDLEKDLEVIQASCLHPEYEIKNCQTSLSSFTLKRVCKICTKEIGFPSQEEIKRWTEK